MNAGILVIGNEILDGHVTDTNSPWLIDRLSSHGYQVDRTTTIRDDPGEIAEALNQYLKYSLDPIFTMGGIGPTPDDMTFSGVANALGVELEFSREIVDSMFESMIGQGKKIDGESFHQDKGVIKMATVPRGAVALRNKTGAAPALLIESGESRIFILPGVPIEFKTIIDDEILGPILKRLKGRYCHQFAVSLTERSLMDILQEFTDRYPDLQLGSYPRNQRRVTLRISGSEEMVLTCVKQLKAALIDSFSEDIFIDEDS